MAENASAGPVLVIGIGNAYARDDGVGLEVARRLRERAPARVKVVERGGEGAELMEAWREAGAVILIDAVRSGARPGTLRRIDCRLHQLDRSLFGDSTHAFSVAEAVELSRVMGRLPARLVVLGVEGSDFTAGTELSPDVRKAVPLAVDAALEEINEIA